MAFQQPALPWEEKALEPHISGRTMSFHYGKHHAAYVKKLNAAVKDTPLAGMELEAVIAEAKEKNMGGVFNNAAQAWNHAFFWESMKPNGGGKPEEKSAIGAKIIEDFGSFEAFAEEFKTTAATHFGSGWAWLVLDNGKLRVMGTHDADTPLVHGVTPLLTLDVWEHAYYLDYQNNRPGFVQVYLDHLVNWEFAEANLAKAQK